MFFPLAAIAAVADMRISINQQSFMCSLDEFMAAGDL